MACKHRGWRVAVSEERTEDVEMTGNENEKLPLLRTWKQEASGTISPAPSAMLACAEELILAMLDWWISATMLQPTLLLLMDASCTQQVESCQMALLI